MAQDEEHLRLLSIFHYVFGGLVGLGSCFSIIHVAIGIAMMAGAMDDASASAAGMIMACIGVAAIAIGWTVAICIIIAGRRLARHTNYTFCLVVAAISCMSVPLGTVLGVFTIIVLNRPTVRQLFGKDAPVNVGTDG